MICSFFSRESAGEKVDLMKKSATRKLRALWFCVKSRGLILCRIRNVLMLDIVYRFYRYYLLFPLGSCSFLVEFASHQGVGRRQLKA